MRSEVVVRRGREEVQRFEIATVTNAYRSQLSSLIPQREGFEALAVDQAAQNHAHAIAARLSELAPRP